MMTLKPPPLPQLFAPLTPINIITIAMYHSYIASS